MAPDSKICLSNKKWGVCPSQISSERSTLIVGWKRKGAGSEIELLISCFPWIFGVFRRRPYICLIKEGYHTYLWRASAVPT